MKVLGNPNLGLNLNTDLSPNLRNADSSSRKTLAALIAY